MPKGRKSKSQRSRGWFHRDNRRALVLCLLFGSVATFGLGAAIQQTPLFNIRFAGNGPGYAATEDNLATGTIVIVPIRGNTCRKKLIDNATWRIRDSGPVDCRAALSPLAHGNQLGWSGSRLDVIRNGFYSR